jgi:hypothetical protein
MEVHSVWVNIGLHLPDKCATRRDDRRYELVKNRLEENQEGEGPVYVTAIRYIMHVFSNRCSNKHYGVYS